MDLFKKVKDAVNAGTPQAIKMERAAGDGEVANFSNVTPKQIGELSVVGKDPIWSKLGMDYVPNAKGTYYLPYEDPIVGEQLAELASVTAQTETDNGTLVEPVAYSVQKVYTNQTLASISKEAFDNQMANMERGCDRKFTTDVFTKILAAATATSAVTDLSEDSFNTLLGSVDSDEEKSLLMNQGIFYANKANKTDSGSGISLMSKDGEFGKTVDGEDVFFSTLFTDATQYAVGAMSALVVTDWGLSEVIIDPYTKAGTRQTVITMNKLLNCTLKNPASFAKSGTLA